MDEAALSRTLGTFTADPMCFKDFAGIFETRSRLVSS